MLGYGTMIGRYCSDALECPVELLKVKLILYQGWLTSVLAVHCPAEFRSNPNQTHLKGILHFYLEIGSFYNSPRVKQLSFTVFESIQPIF